MAPRKTAKPVEPTGFNVNIKHLHKALRLMLRFASSDPSLPSINVVRWETDGKRLIFTATDRFTIGRYTLELHPDETEQSRPQFAPIAMRTADARRLLGFFKPVSHLLKTINVLPGDDGWLFADNEVSFKVIPADVALPPLERIFDAALATAKEAAPMTAARGLDASFVARFHLDRSGMPAVFWPAPPQKPILVTVSDEFMGVIMPVRVVRQADEQLAFVAAELRAAKPAAAVA